MSLNYFNRNNILISYFLCVFVNCDVIVESDFCRSETMRVGHAEERFSDFLITIPGVNPCNLSLVSTLKHN